MQAKSRVASKDKQVQLPTYCSRHFPLISWLTQKQVQLPTYMFSSFSSRLAPGVGGARPPTWPLPNCPWQPPSPGVAGAVLVSALGCLCSRAAQSAAWRKNMPGPPPAEAPSQGDWPATAPPGGGHQRGHSQARQCLDRPLQKASPPPPPRRGPTPESAQAQGRPGRTPPGDPPGHRLEG